MATRTVANLTAVISANNTKFKKGVSGAKKSLGGFEKSVAAIGPAIAAAFSVSVIKNFAKESLELYDKQAKAETKLLTALDGRRGVQDRLIKQAQELQRVTLFGDEATIEAQALIAAFVKEEEQIKKVIPLVQDLATAKGMDLAGAADLVSKTLGSSTNALSRYGIEVEGAVGSAERLKSLMDGLNEAFGGQAEAAAGAGLGAMTQFQNAFGDLKEQIGESLIILLDLNVVLRDLTDILSDIDIINQVKAWKSFKEEHQGTLKAMKSLISPIRAVYEYNKKIFDLISKTEVYQRFEKFLDNTKTKSEEAATSLNEFTQAIGANLFAKLEGTKGFKSFSDFLTKLEDARTGGTEIVSKESVSNVASLSTEIKGLDLSLNKVASTLPEVSGGVIELENDWSNSFSDMSIATKELSNEMAVYFAQIGSSFAASVGSLAAGSKSLEQTIQELSALILGALGDIMIAAGLKLIETPTGIPLILGGLALKGFSSFMGSADFGGNNISVPEPLQSRSTGTRIKGNDIAVANDYGSDFLNRVK